MTLQAIEARRYEEVWAGVPAYAAFSPGERWAAAFDEMTAPLRPKYEQGRVLDVGCGSGKGALALVARGYAVTMCDLTDAGLIEEARAIPFRRHCVWAPLMPHQHYDLVYCADVLEHLPTEFTMLAVARLLDVANWGAFFSIAFGVDHFGEIVGHRLHQTVRSFAWWRDHLREIGHVVEARDLLGCGLFLVRRSR